MLAAVCPCFQTFFIVGYAAPAGQTSRGERIGRGDGRGSPQLRFGGTELPSLLGIEVHRFSSLPLFK